MKGISEINGDGAGATEEAQVSIGASGENEALSKRVPKRSRASAKKAGTWLETAVATYLNKHVDDRIERRRQGGANDRGDIGGVRIHGKRLVLECKNAAKLNLSGWATETETERGNDDSLAGVIVHKRHGKARPEDQWVTLTLGEFVALLTGDRTHYEQPKPTFEEQ